MMDSDTRLVCATQLVELADLLRSLPPGCFAAGDVTVLGTSIGGHVRHLLDHYDCVLDSVSSGSIDYACRSRDSRTETDGRFAVSRCEQLAERLRGLALASATPLAVRHEPGDPSLPANESSLGRELEFLHSHTAHHFALIAILLLRQGLPVPADFGLARSTVRHRDSQPDVGNAESAGA